MLRRNGKAKAIVILFVCLWLPSLAAAESIGSLDLMAGFYNLTAESSSGQLNLSKFGVYKVGFRRQFRTSLEFGASYTVFASQVVTGDLGYGPDLGLFYYPLTDAGPTKYRTQDVDIELDEIWRPFVWSGFHQRSFQSINASYAGFSLGGGTDYKIGQELRLRGEFRYEMLNGPEKSSAKQIDILLGITFSL